MLGSNPGPLRLWHCHPDALTICTRLDLIDTSYPPRWRHWDSRELIDTTIVQGLKPRGSATLDQTSNIRHSCEPRLSMRWGPNVKYSEIWWRHCDLTWWRHVWRGSWGRSNHGWRAPGTGTHGQKSLHQSTIHEYYVVYIYCNNLQMRFTHGSWNTTDLFV